MKTCPQCQSPLNPIGKDFFCLDCDFDTLKPSSFQGVAKTIVPLPTRQPIRPLTLRPPPPRRPTQNITPRWIGVDAEWYFKAQLKKYRKWGDRDFRHVPPDHIGSGSRATGSRCIIYFHRSTIEAHEKTLLFRNYPRQQTPVPEEKRINQLACNLTIRGDVLIANKWTYEMIDKLEPFIPHRWRRNRKFLLADLKKVSETLYLGKPENKVSKTPSVRKPKNKVQPAKRLTQYDFV